MNRRQILFGAVAAGLARSLPNIAPKENAYVTTGEAYAYLHEVAIKQNMAIGFVYETSDPQCGYDAWKGSRVCLATFDGKSWKLEPA